MSYDSNNIFAKIISGEIPCDKIFEDEHTLAFADITPAKQTHVLVIPKGEYESYDAFVQHASDAEIARFFKTVQQVAAKVGVKDSGYRLITNHGKDANQSVPHFHVHILGGENVGPLVAGESELR